MQNDIQLVLKERLQEMIQGREADMEIDRKLRLSLVSLDSLLQAP